MEKKMTSNADDYRQVPVQTATILRESAAHLAYAESLTKDFPYVASKNYIRVLNEFCGRDAPMKSRKSIIVSAQPCCGKSALLANWAKLELEKDPSEQSTIIFQHFAGATYDSVKLSAFLYRLMHRLKCAFNLKDFELPEEYEEEKLKFSLARCLEAATNARGGSKSKTKQRMVIIIVDGIDNLRAEDGSERLAWLPNNIPTGIQFIASATESIQESNALSCMDVTRQCYQYDSEDELIVTELPANNDQDTMTVQELKRRNFVHLAVEPLDEANCMGIMESYNSSLPLEQRLCMEDMSTIAGCCGSSCPLYLRWLLQTLATVHLSYRGDLLAECQVASSLEQLFELIVKLWKSVLINYKESDSKIVAQRKISDAAGTYGKGYHKQKKRAKATDCTTKSGNPTNKSVDTEKMIAVNERRSLLPRHALSFFTVVRCGLGKLDLQAILTEDVPENLFEALFQLLRPHLMQINRSESDEPLFALNNSMLRLIIRTSYLKDETLAFNYHKEMTKYFQSLAVSQRKLDELPFHVEYCSYWATLQAALTDMHMFKVWWTDTNRSDFISYWIVFRNHHNAHDSVEEFVRSLDEYMDGDLSNTKHLLYMLLEITKFLRTWQQHNDENSKPKLNRPEAPFLRELLSCHGSFSEVEADNPEIKSIFDRLCPQPTDGYVVRRWLWAQFPIAAVAFEYHFMEPVYKKNDEIQEESLTQATSSPAKGKPVDSRTRQRALLDMLPSPSRRSESKAVIVKKRQLPKPLMPNQGDAKDEITSFEFLSSDHDNTKVTVSKLKDQLRELRAKYDKLIFSSKEKSSELGKIVSRLEDAQANSDQRGQDEKKQNLNQSRIVASTRATIIGRQRSKYYRLVLRLCETKPAKDPKIMEDSEQEVHQLKLDIVEIQQKAQVISYECKLASIEIPKLTQAIEEKEAIHKHAISRLKWRNIQSVRQNDWELSFRLKSKEIEFQALGDLGTEEESAMIKRTAIKQKDLQQIRIQKKETNAKIQEYEGHHYQDDGLLGILRNVGIHEPRELVSRWKDMAAHQLQLDNEAAACERKLGEREALLEKARQDLQSVKLGIGVQSTTENSDRPNEESESTSIDTNLKLADQQIDLTNRKLKKSHSRFERGRELSEKIQLGLTHILHLLGSDIPRSDDLNEKIVSIDRGVRKLIGEEAMPGAVRRQSSTLKFNAQSTTFKSPADKKTFNIRVHQATSDDESEPIIRPDSAEHNQHIQVVRKSIKHAAKQELDRRKMYHRKLEAKLALTESLQNAES